MRTHTSMKRGSKAALAAAAGLLLLTGVGGTFATWSENSSVGTGNLQSGKLDWTIGTSTWADETAGKQNAITDITTFKMVPGDTVTYTTSVTPTAIGENLEATLKASIADKSGELADSVTVTSSVNGVAGGTFAVTDATDGTAVPVVVTITMPSTTTADEAASLNLSSLTIDLVQTTTP